MAEWALALELAAEGREEPIHTNTHHHTAPKPDEDEDMGVPRRLTITLNTATPPSRQLLTTVRCCQCGYCNQLSLSSFNAHFQWLAVNPHFQEDKENYYGPPEGEELFSPARSSVSDASSGSTSPLRLSLERSILGLLPTPPTNIEDSHQCGLPSDYSTPYQCLGFSGGHQTANEEETERVPCRHVYCLGCQWLVNGEFRVLHPIEIRDETNYTAQGYDYSAQQQYSAEQEPSASGRGSGKRKGGRRTRT